MDECLHRDSARLAPYGSYRNLYRFPDGFQHSEEFDNSPYSHLSKEQKPIPRAHFSRMSNRGFKKRAAEAAKDYSKAEEVYKPLPKYPAQPAANAFAGDQRPYRKKHDDKVFEDDILDAKNRSKAESELENTKQFLWSLYESENMDDEKVTKLSSPPKAAKQIWVCHACTMANGPDVTRCNTCLRDKPDDP
eukprot:TRINITY_DN6762_c0_g1_i2.p1 TRINITY_DN6762_c0_g1~~TRINITY_DN6762_c0_g1_i2.p1  ORF type:complete len:191 (+),score=27.53 TRINITY_DN6762_c0_g1_i2:179-751(+)